MTFPTVSVRRFSHLGITVRDINASVDFYTQVLGSSRCYESVEQGWARVGLAFGETVLELFSPLPPGPSESEVNPFYPMEYGRPKIALTVEDVEVTYGQIVSAGIAPLCPIVSTPVSKFFFILDPDRTPIQLQEFAGGRDRLSQLFG